MEEYYVVQTYRSPLGVAGDVAPAIVAKLYNDFEMFDFEIRVAYDSDNFYLQMEVDNARDVRAFMAAVYPAMLFKGEKDV